MSLFQAVNEEYCNFFGKNPPSRTCISLPFSSEKVSIQAHFSIRPTYIARKVLHVMSISEWAPSCIGPYSQANVIGDSLIFLAGQIPLVPGTMKVQECNSTETEKLYNMHLFVLTWSRAPWWPLCCIQLTACIRHISKLLDSLDSSPNKLVSFTIFVNVGTGSPLHNTIDLRVFENIFKLARLLLIAKCRATNNCDDENEKSEDDQEEINVHLPAISVIGVQGLPRNSLIEVEAVALTNVVATGRIVCMRKGKHKIELVDVSKDINVTQTCRPVPIEASWPFWSTNISRAISFSEAAMFEPQKVLEGCTGIQLISSYFKFYPNVFSFGTFTLMFDIENGWNCVACVIASCLRDYLIESETDIESIKRILIVYSSDSDFTSLKSLLEYYFQILIGIKLCPIIFLPSLGMNVEEGTSNFRISILWEAFNLDKICTEKWLSKDS